MEVVSRIQKRYKFYLVSQRTMQENLKFMKGGEGLKDQAGETLSRTQEDLHLQVQVTSP